MKTKRVLLIWIGILTVIGIVRSWLHVKPEYLCRGRVRIKMQKGRTSRETVTTNRQIKARTAMGATPVRNMLCRMDLKD